MNIEYKVFDLSDWESSIECSILAFSEPPWSEEWTYEQVNERTHQMMSSRYSRGFVAVDGDKVVGLMLGQLRTFLNWKQLVIDDFCVHPDYQGKNIGSQLIDFGEQQLKEEGVTALALTTIRGMPSVKFYEKNGLKLSDTVVFMGKDFK